ncbi:hypothetical protein IWW51_001114 [Coemansia sp. RSA 2702]|nr:hypothetical protein IWW54_002881 [Coemansia sp. RSA 2705]KAJ2314910.1 hypothetical protein IWW52_004168 [Coemansia sp. RSA 2704]KAJ2328585.1 hypothetical protein IWW51_001114 [Coemansia sp. RSA 2702]KAJ2366589.1 hypothetical protein H4S01_002622 [Coemansia sp. RSA 2610]
MSTLLGVRQRQVRVSARKPGVCGAWRGGLESMSRAHWLGGDAADKAEGVRSVYRKRALALRRASGLAARTLVAPEELTAQAILPEEPNGVTSMIAISTVLVFATFAAF